MKASVIQVHDDGFGGWAHGTVWAGGFGYGFETKHFEVGSQFGIDGGKVSKLRVVGLADGREICAYDRCWCVRPDSARREDIAAYNAILKRYN